MHVVTSKMKVTRGIFGAEEYESGYFSAVTETFGTTLRDQSPVSSGVDGFYEGCKLHVKRLQEAQSSLKGASEGGNEKERKPLRSITGYKISHIIPQRKRLRIFTCLDWQCQKMSNLSSSGHPFY